MGFEMRPSWWCQNMLWLTAARICSFSAPSPPRELIILYVIDRKSHRCLNLDFSVSFFALRQFIRPQAEDFRWFIFARSSFNTKCGSNLPVIATPECVTCLGSPGWFDVHTQRPSRNPCDLRTYSFELWKPQQSRRPRSPDEISINFST